MAKGYESFMLDPELKEAIIKAQAKLGKHHDMKISRSFTVRTLIEKGLKNLGIKVAEKQ